MTHAATRDLNTARLRVVQLGAHAVRVKAERLSARLALEILVVPFLKDLRDLFLLFLSAATHLTVSRGKGIDTDRLVCRRARGYAAR